MDFMIGDKIKLEPTSRYFQDMLKYGYSAYVIYTVIDSGSLCIKIDSSVGWFYSESFRLVKDINWFEINKECV